MSTTFIYRGLDDRGKPVRGELVADDRQGATALLKARAIHPTEVIPAEERATGKPPTGGGGGFGAGIAAELTIFTRQLANLVAGGVALMSAFAALSLHTEHPRLRAMLEQLQQDVHGGSTLWEAMARHGAVFPPLYVSMVKAGEASGQLAAVLNWLADYQEREYARRTQIRGALIYPMLLVVVGTIAVILLMLLVVPKFAGIFADFGQALPLPTLVLLNTTHFLWQWGWVVLLALVLGNLAFAQYARTPGGRLRVDGWRLRLPLWGKLTTKAAMSRFARTTATLLRGGVPLLDALTVVRDVVDNAVLAEATDRAREGMREGERFAERLKQTGVFPAFLTQMVGIGEETGDLQNMLITVAGTYDIEVETTLKSLVTLLEPVIIISIGVVLAFIMLSMLLPIYQINLLGS